MRERIQKAGSALRRLPVLLVQWLLRCVVWMAFRPKKHYASEAARQQAFQEPCVLVSNHIRGFDGAAIFTALPRLKVTGLVALDMVEGSRALRLMMHVLPCLTIDRQHPSLSWLRESRKLLKEGRSIYLCPEGRCNFSKAVRPFKPGFVTLAASAGVPVVPVYHNGEYHPVFGRRFRMMIGEPIRMTPPPEGLSAEEMDREAALVWAQVRQLELQLNGTVRTEEDSDEVSH